MAKNPSLFSTTQPPEWQDAIRAESARQGMTTSEWVGKACLVALPAKVREKLPARPAPHRPKAAEK